MMARFLVLQSCHWQAFFYSIIIVLTVLPFNTSAETEVIHVLEPHQYHNPPEKYCPYFNNRLASQRPLNSCAWFQQNSCCTQPEIDVIFADKTLPQNLQPECSDLLDQLMCYICSPDQYMFYNQTSQTLTVCSSFCNKIYSACQDALFKGLPIRQWYRSGDEFCRARKYDIAMSNCMNFTEFQVSCALSNQSCLFIILLILLLQHYLF